MHILMLCEGDASTPRAFSGTGKSMVDHLRALGHRVTTGDVDLRGLQKLAVGGCTWSWPRPRWVSRYHTHGVAFGERSRNAKRSIGAHRDSIDAILQVGATFAPRGCSGIPYFLYCDANFRLAERSANSPWVAPLRASEVEAVVRRERSVYEGAEAIFTLSEMARGSFLTDFEIPPERVVTVHAGPNIDVTRIPALRRLTPRTSSPPSILFVGREFERKGGDLLLQAFTRVRASVPDARLRIVGVRNRQFDIPGVESLGLLRKDHPEELQQLVDAYLSADVFCHPAHFEAFGIVVLEAMFFGLPCVTTRAWALPEMVVDGETGYTVPMNDVDALANRLQHLLAHPVLARRMGDAGYARAQRHFTWSEVARKMTQTMEATLRAGGTVAAEYASRQA